MFSKASRKSQYCLHVYKMAEKLPYVIFPQTYAFANSFSIGRSHFIDRACSVYIFKQVQWTLVISTSLISNNRLSRRETLVSVWHGNLITGNKNCGKEEKFLFSTIF